jgi:hypothetical protein
VAEGAASLLTSGTRSTDASGGEGPGLSPSSSPPRIESRVSVGTWACSCGQGYRVLTEPLTFWAQSSRNGYQPDATTMCISCEADLAETFGLEAAQLVSDSLFR